MRHPTDGVLRRLVDEPAGVTDDERAHVATCPTCLQRWTPPVPTPSCVGSALTPTTASDRHGRGLGAAVRPPARPSAGRSAPRRGWGTAIRRPAVAALSAVVLVTGAGVAAANDWLPIFRTEEVAPIEVTSAELVQLPDLSAYGDLEVTQKPDTEQVADAGAAEARTGLVVPEVSALPEGVTGDPAYQVGGKVSATFTFSAAKAAQRPPPRARSCRHRPPGWTAASLRLDGGSGRRGLLVAAHRDADARRRPRRRADGLRLGRPFETVRDYLLSLPGLPAGLAEQLRDLDRRGATLPLPVPAELVTSSTVDFGGSTATVLESRDGLFSAVVWVEDGMMTGVAGTMSADELLSVARGLR